MNTGSTARPSPAVAARATIEQPRLSSVASVQTHTGVEFPSGTRNCGGSSIAAINSAPRTTSPSSPRGPASTEPSSSITSPAAFTAASAETVWPVPVIERRVAHAARLGAIATEDLPDRRARARPDGTPRRHPGLGRLARRIAGVRTRPGLRA